MNRKIKTEIAFGIILIFTVLISGLLWFEMKEPQAKPCTTEAKICPDGSSVGRSGPNCDFASCPTASKISAQNEKTKTYQNEKYGFEFSYPEKFGEVSFEIGPEVYTPEGEKTGMEIIGTFANVPAGKLIFGGATYDFDDASRSISKVNFRGYIKNSDGYFLSFNRYTGEPQRKMTPKKILENGVLFVDCKSFRGVCSIPDSSSQGVLGTKYEMAGLINLSGSEYKGLIIWADKNFVQEAEFEKILSSVKVF